MIDPAVAFAIRRCPTPNDLSIITEIADNLFTWVDGDRDLVVAILTTGKPIIGPHVMPFIKMLTGINKVYPSPEASTRRDTV